MKKRLTHLDAEGRAAMVDVGHKPEQLRTARASGRIDLLPETIELISTQGVKKGDVLAVAELAGIQAAKRTGSLIPLCHPIPLTHVEVTARLKEEGAEVTATARCVGRTGVEMEALTAAGTALLTIYDMCKAVDKKMCIHDLKLEEKTKTDL